MVAMFGWIIPTPLAMPLTVTATAAPSGPGRATVVVAILVTESVVRSATATASRPASPEVSVGTSAPRPAPTLSSGRRVPMTPVDRCRTPDSSMSSAAATSRPTACWSASPAAPVAAFAEPLVQMTARAQPNPPRASPDVAARLARDRRTGAAANALGVKTAAAAAGPPVVTARARSGRPEALIPAARPPARKPAGMTARRSMAGKAAGAAAGLDPEMVVVIRGPAAAAPGRPSRAGRGRG